MALTLTVAQLSQAVGETVTGSPGPPHLAILARQLVGAEQRIEVYAPDAPDETKNLAAIQMIGWLREAPFASRNPASAFVYSGARDLLAPWRVPVVATVA